MWGACVCVFVCVGVVGEPVGAMAQGGTLAASPEEDRDVGGLSYTCCKQVSPATTWRLLPGRVDIQLVLLMFFFNK